MDTTPNIMNGWDISVWVGGSWLVECVVIIFYSIVVYHRSVIFLLSSSTTHNPWLYLLCTFVFFFFIWIVGFHSHSHFIYLLWQKNLTTKLHNHFANYFLSTDCAERNHRRQSAAFRHAAVPILRKFLIRATQPTTPRVNHAAQAIRADPIRAQCVAN